MHEIPRSWSLEKPIFVLDLFLFVIFGFLKTYSSAGWSVDEAHVFICIIWATSHSEHTSKARSFWWHVFISHKAKRRVLVPFCLKASIPSHWANHAFSIFCPKHDFNSFLIFFLKIISGCLLEFHHCILPHKHLYTF